MSELTIRYGGQARTVSEVRVNGLARAATVSAAGGTPAPTYSATGVFVPDGWGTEWRAYRDGDQAVRREFVVFGDSTTYGSEGMYSYVQKVRSRAVAAGLVDGGKGIFGSGETPIQYDAPEANGAVAAGTTWTGTADSFDSLTGQYYTSQTPGNVLNLQARSEAFRLWYVERSDAGSFTYSVDGGTPVSVNASIPGEPLDRFIYVDGLTADTVHSVQIVNTGGTTAVALAPINESGLAVQKQATSGGRWQDHFHGTLTDWTGPHQATRYQAPMGLLPTVKTDGPDSPTSADSYVANNVIDTTPGAPRPILAMVNLGFNDLSNQADSDFARYIEGIRKFAAACRAAGCDGIVSTGNMPVNANWPTYGAALYAAMQAEALAQHLAFIDLWEPFGGALDWTGGTANPHLSRVQYEAQGDYLWDALLAV